MNFITFFDTFFKKYVYFSIGLSFDGKLVEICPIMKRLCPTQNAVDYLIDDALVIESNDTTIELLILTKPTESGKKLMKIVDYPCKYLCLLNYYRIF